MNNVFACLRLTTCLAALSAGPAFAQTATEDATRETSATAPVAYVYVQTNKGVNLYDAAANGKLTLVKGSPFKTVGSMAGSNRKYFFSLGTDWIHVYPVASNGAIGKQVSEINTQNYEGGECGTTQGARLDHSGQDLYVQLYPDKPVANDQEACAALQSYHLSSTGVLSYLETTEFATEIDTGLNTASTTLVKLNGNGSHAYSASYDENCDLVTWEFKRESNGAMLLNTSEYLTVPSTPKDWRWYPWVVTSDPADHMAVALLGESGDFSPCGDTPHLNQLGSFTENSDGNLATTNTPGNMPTPKVNPEVLNMSPAGQFLAVGGTESYTGVEGTQTAGLQVFHFNGAKPITSFGAKLTSTPVDQIRWDNDNHLYALSYSMNQLFVYTITGTTTTAAPGSPHTITGAYGSSGLIVVPE